MARTATVLEVASSSTPGKSYRVWVDASGPIFCDCPGHKFARGGVRKECRHMRDVRGSEVFDAAVEIAKGGRPVAPKRPAASKRPVPSERIRLLELQEEIEGTWVTVGDLCRFHDLEV